MIMRRSASSFLASAFRSSSCSRSRGNTGASGTRTTSTSSSFTSSSTRGTASGGTSTPSTSSSSSASRARTRTEGLNHNTDRTSSQYHRRQYWKQRCQETTVRAMSTQFDTILTSWMPSDGPVAITPFNFDEDDDGT